MKPRFSNHPADQGDRLDHRTDPVFAAEPWYSDFRSVLVMLPHPAGGYRPHLVYGALDDIQAERIVARHNEELRWH